MQPRQVPYNTGKVKIGLRYEPPKRVSLSDDELRLQKALLWSPDLSEHIGLKRYIGAVVFTCLLGLVLAYAPR